MNKYAIIIALVTALVFIALGSYLIHSYGSAKESEGSANTTAQINEKVIKKVKNYEKAKIKVRTVSDDALIRRYCKFVYDTTYDECLSSVRIIK